MSRARLSRRPATRRIAPVEGDSRFRYQREQLVAELRTRRGISDDRVLSAMGSVPRHLFVPDHYESQAYGDFALPIGQQQTISQPFVVARMTEYLNLGEDHSVLEIGTGSGYQTAVLSLLCRVVYSIERVPELAKCAISRMRTLDLPNVKIHIFDGSIGWSERSPFDRILVTAGAPTVPKALLDQLAVGGRMVLPEGPQEEQRLAIYDRKSPNHIERSFGEPVKFVPLIGRDAWRMRED